MADLPSCETLKLKIERGILHVTLDRPETKNALNKAMVRDLTAAVDYLAAHQDIRAAVFRGGRQFPSPTHAWFRHGLPHLPGTAHAGAGGRAA